MGGTHGVAVVPPDPHDDQRVLTAVDLERLQQGMQFVRGKSRLGIGNHCRHRYLLFYRLNSWEILGTARLYLVSIRKTPDEKLVVSDSENGALFRPGGVKPSGHAYAAYQLRPREGSFTSTHGKLPRVPGRVSLTVKEIHRPIPTPDPRGGPVYPAAS